MTAAIHRLHFATVWSDDEQIEVYGYLVLTKDRAVLIDTGVGHDSAVVETLFRPKRSSVPELLARHGVDAGDISTVINSHLHYDHCGNNRLFPNADIVVQSAEVMAARQPKYTIENWFDYDGVRLVEVSGDRDIVPGIRVIASPGHTPGHQSVLIEDTSEPTLIAAQAAFTAAEYHAGGDPAQSFKGMEAAYLETIARLKSLKAHKVCFSHDRSSVRNV